MSGDGGISIKTGISNILATITSIRVFDIIDILLVAVLIYMFVRLVRDTRANQLVKGILLFLGVYIILKVAPFKAMNFLMQAVFQFGATALIVVFQPELRRALERVGRTQLPMSIFGSGQSDKERAVIHRMVGEFMGATRMLSKTKTGALMVFEMRTRLGDIIKTGTVVDAQASEQLICNIFFINSPLHDGAMVIRGARLHAAGCFLPLTENNELSKELGTRHRAAIGMSENSDALIVVVSEETGVISVARNGVLKRDYTPETLADYLRHELLPSEQAEPRVSKLAFWRKKND